MYRKISFPILALLAVLAFSPAARAQDSATDRTAQMREKLKTDLKMTDLQADSAMAIMRDTRPQRQAVMQDASLTPEDKRTKMKAIGDAADTRLKAALGDKLFEQYKAWMRENRPRRGPDR